MNFYRIKQDDRYPDLWYSDNDDFRNTIICPKHNGHQRGMRDENKNLNVEVKKLKLGDFVSTVFNDLLITDNVADLFEKHNLTGYKLNPVNVCNMKLPFNLWEFVATGKADYDPACGIKEIYRCEYCDCVYRRHYFNSTGIIIDESTWDGSDFFRIEPYPTYIFVTEKIKNFIEKYNLDGMTFVLSTDLRIENIRPFDENKTKEEWKEYFERDITPLKEKLINHAKESWRRAGLPRP